MDCIELIDRLKEKHHLNRDEWVYLFSNFTKRDRIYAAEIARAIAIENYGKKVFFRGIIEFSNICKNDCLYCGIRKSNSKVERYRLTLEEIMNCCKAGYENGFRTFVLQGGEDGWFDDDKICEIIHFIKKQYSDCAVTLSLGERERDSYQRLFDAGADRYLLRHETANEGHYGSLHPSNMSFEHRMKCLKDLKEIGYQVGCGLMVGSPGQSPETLADDMIFMEEFQPHMIGIGPFLAQKDTPFAHEANGNVDLTLFLLSLCRIMLPYVLLPSTTALSTADGNGRKKGVLCGCNVVMPNLSPDDVREKYALYDNKAGTDTNARDGFLLLKKEMDEIGYQVVIGRGDSKLVMEEEKYENCNSGV